MQNFSVMAEIRKDFAVEALGLWRRGFARVPNIGAEGLRIKQRSLGIVTF